MAVVNNNQQKPKFGKIEGLKDEIKRALTKNTGSA